MSLAAPRPFGRQVRELLPRIPALVGEVGPYLTTLRINAAILERFKHPVRVGARVWETELKKDLRPMPGVCRKMCSGWDTNPQPLGGVPSALLLKLPGRETECSRLEASSARVRV
jgi:hypothetical protein